MALFDIPAQTIYNDRHLMSTILKTTLLPPALLAGKTDLRQTLLQIGSYTGSDAFYLNKLV